MSDTSLVFNLVARERVSETLGKVREKFDAAATGIAAGVAGALGVGVAAAMDMSAANAKLAAQLGVGPAKAAELATVSAHVYANAWGDSSETVNEAIRGVYNNIGDVSKAKGGLEGVTSKALALSETFDQEVGPTTAAVGQLMRTGLASNADEAFDIITKGFQSSANKADDFLDTINEYSTQFRRVGLDGQTATGLLAQGLQAGARDADQVADAIGQFGERALAGGAPVEAAFKAIGLNAGDMAKEIGMGGSHAEAALQKTMDGLRGAGNEQTKLNVAAALFGDPGNVLGKALFALDPASAAASSGMDKAAGSTDRLMDTVANSPAKTLEKFKRQAITKLAEVGASFIGFATEHQDVMVPLAYTLGGIAAAVLVIKGAMMAWATAQAVWTAATTIATGVQWLWNAALLANPMVWIIIGIVALVAAIVLIATKTTWFQQLWTVVWGAVKSAIATVWNWIKSNWPLLLAILAGPIGLAVLAIVRHWDQIKAAGVRVWNWIKGLPGRIGGALSAMGAIMLAAGLRGFQKLKDGASQKATAFLSWATGLPGRISRSVGSMGSMLTSKGHAVVQGLWAGIQGMGGWLRSKLIGWAKSSIPGPIAKALGINSPSKVTTQQGRWIARGLIAGMTGTSKQVKSTAAKLADIVADALSPGKKRSKALSAISSGSKALMKLADREASVAARMKTANKRVADLIKDRDKLAADVKKGVLDAANITQQQGSEGPATAGSILAGLQDKLARAKQWAADLATLAKKGIRGDLIAQISQAGVEQGSAAASALASADKNTVKQINATQGSLVAAAGKAGSVAGNAMYGAGIQAAQGIVKGLKKEQASIEKQMLKIAKGMQSAIRKALGIKSPSTLMADTVGRFIPPGVVAGMKQTTPQLESAMRGLVTPDLATPSRPLTASGMAPLMGASAAGGPLRVIVDVRGADEDLKKMFRKIVRVDGRGTVQTAFGRNR